MQNTSGIESIIIFLKTDYFTGQVCKDKRAKPNVEQWKGWEKERIL